jgi:hypothetical protein
MDCVKITRKKPSNQKGLVSWIERFGVLDGEVQMRPSEDSFHKVLIFYWCNPEHDRQLLYIS